MSSSSFAAYVANDLGLTQAQPQPGYPPRGAEIHGSHGPRLPTLSGAPAPSYSLGANIHHPPPPLHQPSALPITTPQANATTYTNDTNDGSPTPTPASAQTVMDATSAVPTVEDKARYENARKELIQALQKKRMVDKQLAMLEVQIYNFEGSYLTDTTAHSGGNIIQGFDAYLKTQNVGRRRHEITDADRMFSNSSLSYHKSLELVGDGEENGEDGGGGGAHGMAGSSAASVQLSAAPGPSNSRGPTPGLTTVVLPPPSSRTQQELSAAQQKKARDKEYQRRKRANAASLRNSMAAQSGEDDGEGQNQSIASGTSRRSNKRPRAASDE